MKTIVLKYVKIGCLIAITATAQAQDSLSVEACFSAALRVHPLARQKEMHRNIAQLQTENLNSNWLPNIDLNAKATYQSDVTEIDIPVPGIDIPSPDKDQYAITFDVKQLIWDGGTIKESKKLELASLDQELAGIESDLYSVYTNVANAYYSCLILQETSRIIDSTLSALDSRIHSVTSAIENGVLLAGDLNRIKARKIELLQEKTAISERRKATLNVLALLTGINIPSHTYLKRPAPVLPENSNLNRPEERQFDLSKQQMDALKKLNESQRYPVIAAFGQAGYGKPGLNFLSDEFNPYYIVGLNLSWKIWDWNQTDRKTQVLDIRKDIVETNRESFNLQIQIAQQNELANIRYYQSLAEQDEQIIILRKSLTQSAAAMLNEGTITSADYITELLEEHKALINKETHIIKYHQAITNLLILTGSIQ